MKKYFIIVISALLIFSFPGNVLAEDHAPPVTTASFSSSPDAQGEYSNPSTITLSATAAPDYLISQTYFTVDGGPQHTYNDPFSVDGSGTHTITYWSVDNAGLEETPHKTLSFTLQHEGIQIDSAEWVNETTVRFHYSNNSYAPGQIGLAFVTPEGNFHAGAFGWPQSQESGYVDWTGNVGDIYHGGDPGYTRYFAIVGESFADRSNIIRLPAHPPVSHDQPITTATFSQSPNAQGEYTRPLTISLEAQAATGYLITQTFYTIDGGFTEQYNSPITINSGGNHTISYWSVDNAGLVETPHKTSSFTIQQQGIHIDSAEWLNSTTIRFHYSQNTYAPGSIGLAYVTPEGDFHAGAFGWSESETAGYVDWTGNVGDIYHGGDPGYTRYFALVGADFADRSNIIRLPQYIVPPHDQPVTTATFSSEPDAQGEYPNPTTVSLTATAAPGFSVQQIFYTVDDGATQVYSAPFSVDGSGNHTLNYWSVDNSGLEEAHNTKTLILQHEGIQIDRAVWLNETTIRFYYSQNSYAPEHIGLSYVTPEGAFHAGAFGWAQSESAGYLDWETTSPSDLYHGADPGFTRYYALVGESFADRSNIIRLPAYDGSTQLETFTISGNVYIDTNSNGFKDTNESNYEGATITISGNTNATVTTNTDGIFTSSNHRFSTYTITLTTPNGYSHTTQNSVSIPVSANTTVNFGITPVNNAPKLATIGNKTVNEGELLQFTVSANNPDGDSLTYSAANLPEGASFDSQTHTFTWTPGFNQEGNYENIEFTVTDDGTPLELDTKLITITVGNINRAPIFNPIGSQEVQENKSLTFTASATDPDGDSVTLSSSNLPAGASFNPQTGIFSWTPNLSQAGNYVVTFYAIDNGTPVETGQTDVSITVGDDPTPTEQSQNLIDVIVTYDFPTNVENSYLANLKKVKKFIEEGTIEAAHNQLNAFITKVNADYSKGIITQEVRDNLINLAQSIIDDLQ